MVTGGSTVTGGITNSGTMTSPATGSTSAVSPNWAPAPAEASPMPARFRRVAAASMSRRSALSRATSVTVASSPRAVPPSTPPKSSALRVRSTMPAPSRPVAMVSMSGRSPASPAESLMRSVARSPRAWPVFMCSTFRPFRATSAMPAPSRRGPPVFISLPFQHSRAISATPVRSAPRPASGSPAALSTDQLSTAARS